MLSVAKEPRDVFAIGLVNARAGACAVILGEPLVEADLKAAHERPGTGGVLEGETSIAACANDGHTRILPEHLLEEGCDCRKIDV